MTLGRRGIGHAPVGLWLVLAVACGSAAAPAPAAPSARPPTAGEPASAAPTARPAAERVNVSFASLSAVYTPHLIGLDKGYYAEEGLEIEMVRVGGGVATPALLAGELQYSTSAATSISAMLKGAPLKIIYTNSDRAGYDIWSSAPEIRALPDLVGRALGVQSRGDTMEVAARMVLALNGIDHNGVSFVAMGVGNQRLVALQNGTIPAAVLGTSDTVELRDAGVSGHLVSNLRKDIQMLYTGVVTSDQELRERPDRVRRFLRATVKGREYYKTFREESIDVLTRYNEKTREANVADYDDVLPAMPPDASMPVEIQQRDTAMRAEINGVDQVPPVEQIFDYAPVKAVYREVLASGWKPAR